MLQVARAKKGTECKST